METSEERRRLLTHLDETIAKAASEEQAYKTLMHESKARRDSEMAMLVVIIFKVVNIEHDHAQWLLVFSTVLLFSLECIVEPAAVRQLG